MRPFAGARSGGEGHYIGGKPLDFVSFLSATPLLSRQSGKEGAGSKNAALPSGL